MAPGSFARSQQQKPAPTVLVEDAPPHTKRNPVGNRPTPAPQKRERSSGPTRTTPRAVGQRSAKTIKAGQAFIGGRVQNPERVIALELILATTIYVAIKLYEGKTPAPRVLAALLAVYAILGLVTIFGPRWGRVAYLFGGLVLIAIMFNKEAQAAAAKLGVGGKSTQLPGSAPAAGPVAAQAILQTAAFG